MYAIMFSTIMTQFLVTSAVGMAQVPAEGVHNEVDQGSIWGLSQYLPNNVLMAPIDRMDE